MYKVYFSNGYEITQVQDVQFGHERDIKIHDGLGQGKFPIPDSKGLKTWTIKCQQEDNALFAKLEKLLCSKEETRLVISSNAENISELVLLKSYDKQEVFSGVFNITIKFIEYVKAGIRTTDVPFIARPGKVPVPPKTVVFDGKGSTPYKAALKELKSLPHKTYAQNQVDKIYEMELVEKDTGKTVNPCLAEIGKEYVYGASSRAYGYKYAAEHGTETLFKEADSKKEDTYFGAIKSFIDTWNEKAAEFNKKQNEAAAKKASDKNK